jgi:hypothetical protein
MGNALAITAQPVTGQDERSQNLIIMHAHYGKRKYLSILFWIKNLSAFIAVHVTQEPKSYLPFTNYAFAKCIRYKKWSFVSSIALYL